MDWILALAGFVIGVLVGITGAGGGSLMTPFLLFYGIPPSVAVGTDLAYAAAAKGLGVWLRHRARSVDWRAASLLMAGSIPASLAVVGFLHAFALQGALFETVITRILAVSLILTAVTVLGQPWLRSGREDQPQPSSRPALTLAVGVLLGALVTLSSVGSGSLGTALLLLMFPYWSSARVVGTDLAYAVPLTVIAALGHAYLGNVDAGYFASLVIGAAPGMFIGTRMGLTLPDRWVRRLLGGLLLLVGLSLLFK